MTIKEAQEAVDKWINTIGVQYFSELTNMAMLTEEVGEVARIIARRYGEQSEKDSDKDKDLGDELADVLFVIFGFFLNRLYTPLKMRVSLIRNLIRLERHTTKQKN